jgi:hypothetical protein
MIRISSGVTPVAVPVEQAPAPAAPVPEHVDATAPTEPATPAVPASPALLEDELHSEWEDSSNPKK